jgi:hypothetical protein
MSTLFLVLLTLLYRERKIVPNGNLCGKLLMNTKYSYEISHEGTAWKTVQLYLR